MGEPMSRIEIEAALTRVGKEAARLQDEELPPRAEPGAGARFEQAWNARRTAPVTPIRRSLPPRAAWGAVALVAAAALVALWARPRPLSFSVRDEAGQVGAWMIVSAESVPLRFSDGSRITLEDDALARVTNVTQNGAEIVVPRGHVRATVVHTPTSQWKVDVGPFVVDVTGTTFATGWDPKEQVFTLDLTEGSVVVTGCSIRPQLVHPGTSVRLRCKQDSVATEPTGQTPILAPSAESEHAEAGPAATETLDAGVPPEPAPSSPRKTPDLAALPDRAVDASVDPTWLQLAARGDNRAAFAAALPQFDAVCDQGSAADVMALADVARFAADSARARKALLAVRTRFAGTSHAKRAAFLLGRLSFDGGAFADAARWFETASSEDPAGPLARESDGRLIEARERGGDHAGARAAAQRYLQRYPSGPHASLAIQVLEH